MGEVTTVCKVQSHEFVARVEHGEEYGCISLCTGVRLYVGPFCAENLFQAVDGNLLTLVYYLTTTIVALAGIPFSILVGEAGAIACITWSLTKFSDAISSMPLS